MKDTIKRKRGGREKERQTERDKDRDRDRVKSTINFKRPVKRGRDV